MSHSEFSDKFTPATGQDAVGSTPRRPVTRGERTYYADGIIEYEYTPRFAKAQRVCGLRGKDKAETIEIVKKAFPDLVEVDVGRFGFEIYDHRGLTVRVMDEVWELLNKDPPLVWIIKIKELPKERDLRISEERNSRVNQQWICFFIIVAIVIAFALVIYFFLAVHNML